MRREELLTHLTGVILRRKQEDRPLRVAIDGRAASGKTTLANQLASVIAAIHPGMTILRPSVDGFHHPREFRYRQGEYSARGYYEDAYDYATLIESLLRPLSGESFPVLCRQVSQDVRTDLPDDAPPTNVSANTILLFEGLFLFRREINRYWDYRILRDVEPETSISRSVVRDTGLIGTADVVRKKCELRYEPAWQIYVSEEQPAAKADLIIDTRDLQDPQIRP